MVAEIPEVNLVLSLIAFTLIFVMVAIVFLAARRFAGDLGRGMNLLAVGMILMSVNFLLGLADHMSLAGGETLLAHPGWIHGSIILVALATLLAGFLIIYRTAMRVASS